MKFTLLVVGEQEPLRATPLMTPFMMTNEQLWTLVVGIVKGSGMTNPLWHSKVVEVDDGLDMLATDAAATVLMLGWKKPMTSNQDLEIRFWPSKYTMEAVNTEVQALMESEEYDMYDGVACYGAALRPIPADEILAQIEDTQGVMKSYNAVMDIMKTMLGMNPEGDGDVE